MDKTGVMVWGPDYPNTPVMVQSRQELKTPDRQSWHPTGTCALGPHGTTEFPAGSLGPRPELFSPLPTHLCPPGNEWVSSCPQALAMSFPAQA